MRDFTFFKIIPLMLFAFLILYPGFSYSQSTGSIGGTIVDSKDNNPLVGATVKLTGYNIGAVTDDNGNYIILNVDVGTYDIEASYIGYDTKKVTGIKVSVDQRTKINFDLTVKVEGFQTEVIVIEGERKTVENSGRIIDVEQIKNSGTRGVTNIVSKTAGVVQDERGGSINIRGGRSNESIVIVDGVETTNPLDGSSRASVPNSLMQEISVLTGGFGAEYGNVLSGVINVSTKSGSDKYTGSVELVTDEFTGRYIDSKSQGYNLYNVTFGGPIIPTKKLARVFNFFGSAERTFNRIAIGSWILDKLPTMVPDGKLKDDESGNFSYNGRLNINLKEIQNSKVPINLKLGATVNSGRSRVLRGSFILNNSDRNQVVESNDYQYFARISHEISRNFFYELQFNYLDSKSKTSDPVFGDNLGWYGDTNHVPGLAEFYGHQFAQGKAINGTDPDAGGLFTLKNVISNGYSQSDLSYLGGKLDATWAIITKKAGDHEIKFGGEYKYHTLKSMSVLPVILADATISDPIEKWYSTGSGRLKSYGYQLFDPVTGTQVADGTDAKHPIMGGVYLRDKVSFADFNFNGGFRVDFFDVNDQVLKSITTDLVGPDGILISPDDFTQSKMKFFVSPRLGFSFPVTDKTVFHAQYGKMVQMPQLQLLYVNQETMRRFFSTSLQDVIENSSLEPTKLTSYEIGLKHQVGDIIDLGLTAFYKESKDLIGAGRVKATSDGKVPIGFVTYFNSDFAISRGVDFYIHMRRIERLAFNFDYSLKYASGTGSDPFSKSSLANNSQEQLPVYVYALDYDQRHTGSLNFDYRFGDNDVPKGFLGSVIKNLGLNVDFSFNSGRPYTRHAVAVGPTDFNSDPLLSAKNEVYTNWQYRVDLKLDKSILLWKSNWNFYIYVINLLNTEIVDEVFPGTGLPDDNGYLQTPSGAQAFANNAGFRKYWPERIKFLTNWTNGSNYGPPRQVRFGLNISF